MTDVITELHEQLAAANAAIERLNTDNRALVDSNGWKDVRIAELMKAMKWQQEDHQREMEDTQTRNNDRIDSLERQLSEARLQEAAVRQQAIETLKPFATIDRFMNVDDFKKAHEVYRALSQPPTGMADVLAALEAVIAADQSGVYTNELGEALDRARQALALLTGQPKTDEK